GLIVVDQHALPARLASDIRFFDRDRAVETVQELEHPCHGMLWLHCDNPRAEPSKGGDAIADMRAHVEDKITRLNKSPIQAVHGRGARPVTVVDTQRPDSRTRSPDGTQNH